MESPNLFFSLCSYLYSSSLSNGAFNQLEGKHLQFNNPLFITGKYIKSLLTIVTTATSLGIPSENQIDNFTGFQSLEFQMGSVSWYQEGTPALPPWHPTFTGFHQSTIYPLVNWAPSIGLLA